jgi:hypothetical protein
VAVAVPAGASPLREVEYSVTATSDGLARHARVRLDFQGGDARAAMQVALDEMDGTNEENAPNVTLDHTGVTAIDNSEGLTDEEEAICYFMALESQDMDGLSRGDNWVSRAAVPGGQQTTHFVVTDVTGNGYIAFSVQRSIQRRDGSTANWRGTMTYDAHAIVPTSIALQGEIDPAGQRAPRRIALAITLASDTFQRQ